MKHEYAIESCRAHAAAQIKLAEFIADRCEAFELVCAHNSTGRGGLPSLHVYEGGTAMREFGEDGWQPCDYDPAEAVSKTVDGVIVSAARIPAYIPTTSTFLP